MNENLNLVEILKDCPKGTKLYSTVYGEVEFDCINKGEYSVKFIKSDGYRGSVSAQGMVLSCYDGECILFPSREQRDWSKFKVKKPKFDPKTFKPFDKVLVREGVDEKWYCNLFSHRDFYGYAQIDGCTYDYCIPYNDDTKHLIGAKEEAPEFYRYWED